MDNKIGVLDRRIPDDSSMQLTQIDFLSKDSIFISPYFANIIVGFHSPQNKKEESFLIRHKIVVHS